MPVVHDFQQENDDRHDTNMKQWELWCSANIKLLIEARVEKIKRWQQNSINISN